MAVVAIGETRISMDALLATALEAEKETKTTTVSLGIHRDSAPLSNRNGHLSLFRCPFIFFKVMFRSSKNNFLL